jgi:hypothetical protein
MIRTFLLALGVLTSLSFAPAPSTLTPVAVLVATPSEVSAPGDGSNPCVPAPPLGWTCTITLHETAASTEPLNWLAVSNGVLNVKPSTGKLFPGQTVKVKVNAGCNGWDAFDFIYDARGLTENGVAVMYACG